MIDGGGGERGGEVDTAFGRGDVCSEETEEGEERADGGEAGILQGSHAAMLRPARREQSAHLPRAEKAAACEAGADGHAVDACRRCAEGAVHLCSRSCHVSLAEIENWRQHRRKPGVLEKVLEREQKRLERPQAKQRLRAEAAEVKKKERAVRQKATVQAHAALVEVLRGADDSDVESIGGESEWQVLVEPKQPEPQAEQQVEVQVASEKEAVSKNFSVRRHHGADRSTGIEALQLPVEVDVGKLAEAVRDGFAAGSRSSNSHVGCRWDLGQERALEVGGYGRYGLVNGEHQPREQYKVTAVLDRCSEPAMLLQYCHVLPGLHEVLHFCLQRAPGRSIAFVHLLNQDSVQAQFRWHQDNNKADIGYGDIDLSFVFCLTETVTSMQIAGKYEFWYGGAGSGALFRASYWHRSGEAAEGILKLAVFLSSRK